MWEPGSEWAMLGKAGAAHLGPQDFAGQLKSLEEFVIGQNDYLAKRAPVKFKST